MIHRPGKSRRLQSGVLLLLFLASVQGCRRSEPLPQTALSTERFVETVVALRSAAYETGDQAAFEARRQEILATAEVTDSMLLEFVRVRARDLEGMRTIWDTIAARRNVPRLEPLEQ
jgi:hypothetical protein